MSRIKKEALLETIKPLLILEGYWEGIGRGSYPTLEPFSYKEETSFKVVKGEPYIQMTQKAWVIDQNSWKFIHWETGIIAAVDSNKLKFYTCHMNGRIEVSFGKHLEHPKYNKIEFKSELIKNEKDLKPTISSQRIFLFDTNTFQYSLGMSTSDISTMENHIEAKLSRVK